MSHVKGKGQAEREEGFRLNPTRSEQRAEKKKREKKFCGLGKMILTQT
jgi:hypothetical protein